MCLEYGFDLHVDESKLPGKKVLRNYKSAYENKEKVYKALKKRVHSGKTVKLGSFDGRASQLPGERGRVVPNGAVPKKLEPDSARPFSDHTKTGFNSACDIGFLDHSLDTYNEIATELKPGYSMRVEDIEGAYTVLPLAPKVWKYMYVWWYDVDLPLDEQVAPNTLYVHVYGDFGTSTMPGVWDKFFRCVKAMAALDGVLTLPMPHYVDDNSLIGPDAKVVDAEAEKLGLYLQKCGLSFKVEALGESRALGSCDLSFLLSQQGRKPVTAGRLLPSRPVAHRFSGLRQPHQYGSSARDGC